MREVLILRENLFKELDELLNRTIQDNGLEKS